MLESFVAMCRIQEFFSQVPERSPQKGTLYEELTGKENNLTNQGD